MKSTDFFIENKKGVKLACTLDMPDNDKADKFSIFSHCFTCSKELKAIANIHSAMTGHGIGCVRFDYTGIGKSEGEFSETNLSVYIEDLKTVYNYITENYSEPSALIGHSFGGSVVLESAKYFDNVKAVVVIGTSSETTSIAEKFSDVLEDIKNTGYGKKDIGGAEYTFTKQFFEDIAGYNLPDSINNLKKPLLIMHSPVDTYSPVEEAGKIFQAAKHPKSYISLDDIDHLMLNKEDAVWTGELISAWLKKYI